MASSRDDFIIAIRSAFLKKSTKQKFSLLTLVFLSIFIIVLSNLNFKPIKQLRKIINEIVYRTSFVVSIPENLIERSYSNIKVYSNFYNDYKNNKKELEKLKSENISNEIIKNENEELKNLIEDYTLTTNKILAKVIVDRESPFLKTIIINKGSSENIKIGTNIYDRNYLVGRVIEVNFKSSRVLLLSDLNSNVPASITPGNIQAIIVGNGENFGEIKYIKGSLVDELQEKSIVYTSGAGSIFRSGIPIGKITIDNKENSKKIFVNFYSDFTQLKYVFAEIINEKVIQNKKNSDVDNEEILNEKLNTEKIKLDLLNDEIEIFKQSNSKFIEENEKLKSKIIELNEENLKLKTEISSIDEIKNKNIADKEELKFLRLNLIHGGECRKTLFNDGYKIGSEEYRNCVLSRGKKFND